MIPTTASHPKRNEVPGRRKRASSKRARAVKCSSSRLSPGTAGRALFPRNDPDRMNDPGNVAQQGQQDVNPEMQTESDLQKDTHGREQDRKNDTNNVHTVW